MGTNNRGSSDCDDLFIIEANLNIYFHAYLVDICYRSRGSSNYNIVSIRFQLKIVELRGFFLRVLSFISLCL